MGTFVEKQILTVYLEAQIVIQIEDIQGLKHGIEIFELIKKEFRYKNPKFIENEKWGYSNSYPKITPKYLMSYMTDEQNQIRIARGGIEKLQELLAPFNITLNVINNTLTLPRITHKGSNLILREDQELFVSSMIQYEQGSGIGIGQALEETCCGCSGCPGSRGS